MNSRTALLVASTLGLTLALGVVVRAGATDSDTDATTTVSSSTNAATPATPYPGEGQRATPAMPGNPRAEEEVERHRPDFDHRPDVDRPDVDRPDVDRPDIQRPDIEVPETMDR